MSNANPHARIDAINRAVDQATAAKIRARPELIEIGKAKTTEPWRFTVADGKCPM